MDESLKKKQMKEQRSWITPKGAIDMILISKRESKEEGKEEEMQGLGREEEDGDRGRGG